MKTLKQLLELKKPNPTMPNNAGMVNALEPRGFDEKRFKDKHTVNKKADVNGNKDDVFKATNVKVHDRGEHHGYHTGADAKVYEEVKPKTLKQILEKHLTAAEKEKREDIAQGIEKSNPDMPMGKKMAIATAKAEKVAEEALLESDSSAATYDNYCAHSQKMLNNISKAIDQHSKHVKTKSHYNTGEPQWHHVEHVKHIHRQLQDMHDFMQQNNDYAKPIKASKLKEEVEQPDLFDVFAEDIRQQVKDVYESLDDENKQVMIEMIETGDYDTVVEIVKETLDA